MVCTSILVIQSCFLYRCRVGNEAEILKVANYSKWHVIKFEISSFYQHEYMLLKGISAA